MERTSGEGSLGHPKDATMVAPGDLIRHILGNVREALVSRDGTDAQHGVHPILSRNWLTDGQAISFAGVMVRKDPLKDPMRAGERPWVKHVAGSWHRSCRSILLTDRGGVSREKILAP